MHHILWHMKKKMQQYVVDVHCIHPKSPLLLHSFSGQTFQLFSESDPPHSMTQLDPEDSCDLAAGASLGFSLLVALSPVKGTELML